VLDSVPSYDPWLDQVNDFMAPEELEEMLSQMLHVWVYLWCQSISVVMALRQGCNALSSWRSMTLWGSLLLEHD